MINQKKMEYITSKILDSLIGKVSDSCRDHFNDLVQGGGLDNATVRIPVKPKQVKPKQGTLIFHNPKQVIPQVFKYFLSFYNFHNFNLFPN